MKLKIEITMDSAAFEGANRNVETARILQSLAQDMADDVALSCTGDHETLMDINGNRVGEARVTR
jgi:hypothetical protein